MGSQKVGLTEWLSHICVTRDNLQTVAHLTRVPCNGFSFSSKWNWKRKACQYILKKILLSLSNMFWGSLTWKGLFWMGQSVSSVAQWCLTLCNSMDYIVHGILQTRILEWVAFPFSRGSSQPRNQIGKSPALQADSLPAELPEKSLPLYWTLSNTELIRKIGPVLWEAPTLVLMLRSTWHQ